MPAQTTLRRTRSPKPGTLAWNAERRTAIFATDAAAVVGMSRFSDPHMVYLEKLGLTAPKIQTSAMRWGNVMESVIAREWAAEEKRKIMRLAQWTYWRDGHGFPLATHLDYGLVAGMVDSVPQEIVEIKTAGQFAAADFGEEGTDQVPKDYLLQCVHEMAVVGAEVCHLVVLIGGNKLGKYRIEHDPVLAAKLIDAEREAWQGVVNREPPPIDGSEGSTELLRAIQPTDDGTEIEVDDRLEALAFAYLGAKADEKGALAQQAELGNKIRAILGTHSGARGGAGIEITYRQSKPTTTVTWEAVAREAAANADVLARAIEAHATTKPGLRPLLVKIKEA